MENQPLDSMETQQSLPNSTGILVMGILSIVLCCCYGIVGIILAIISLILAQKSKNLYLATPEIFTESSYKNMKAGKICAIIGLCLSCLYLVYSIVMLSLALTGEMEGVLEELIREIRNH